MKPTAPIDDLSAPYRWKQITLATISISLLALSVTPVFIDPVLVAVKYAFRIGNGTLIYNILTNEMPGALVEAYIFNITNAEKFIAGEDHKIKVEEIGPFTYQEFRTHEDLFLNNEDHTMRYTPLISTRFHRELSVADPKDVNVSVPNIPLLTMGSTMGSYPYLTQMGFNVLVSSLQAKPVINLKAHDFMWGYKEPLIALGNKLMPGWINFENLGLMDRLYDQTVKDTLVLGTSDADKFRIKTVNGKGGISNRGFDPSLRDHCNTFVDTYEGLSYPSDLTPDTKLRLYRNVFCRILDLQYVGTEDIEFGPKAFVYRLSNTTFRKNSENECLCGKVCVDGMTDLSSCFYGFGVSFSQAHFLDVDPKLYERIEGVHPDFNRHGSKFVVDSNYGSVLDTRLTLQLNLVVENADFNEKTRPFSRMIIPVLYFRIVQPELPEETKTAFRNIYFVFPYVIIALQVFLFLVAVGLLLYATRFVRFAWLCKHAIDYQVNKNTKPGPVYEEPLIEESSHFMAELIANKRFIR